ncbi:MAG: glycosyltransferase family 2 protein [Planctomycetaceae bacterium]|nr:glycosyltransferase family 2 protein [Planctomycetaceae bacterium]
MSSEQPFVSCLCPTYRRPKLLENSIACFLAQDYPADRRELIVLDDAGELLNQTGEGWQIISIPRRFRSLPEKFNALAGLARGEILIVWEDDDIYLPHHISSHVAAMNGHLWSKPSKVLSDYTGQIEEEDATGRFHASLAFTRLAFEVAGGWPLTMRGDFDQQLIARFTGLGPAGDPCALASSSYVFRWGSTGAYHGQALMKGPDDENWYIRAHQVSSIDLPMSQSQGVALGSNQTLRLTTQAARNQIPTLQDCPWDERSVFSLSGH